MKVREPDLTREIEADAPDQWDKDEAMDRAYGPADCCGTWPEVCEFHFDGVGQIGSSVAADHVSTAIAVAS